MKIKHPERVDIFSQAATSGNYEIERTHVNPLAVHLKDGFIVVVENDENNKPAIFSYVYGSQYSVEIQGGEIS